MRRLFTKLCVCILNGERSNDHKTKHSDWIKTKEVPERENSHSLVRGLREGNIQCKYKILYIKQFDVTLNMYLYFIGFE